HLLDHGAGRRRHLLQDRLRRGQGRRAGPDPRSGPRARRARHHRQRDPARPDRHRHHGRHPHRRAQGRDVLGHPAAAGGPARGGRGPDRLPGQRGFELRQRHLDQRRRRQAHALSPARRPPAIAWAAARHRTTRGRTTRSAPSSQYPIGFVHWVPEAPDRSPPQRDRRRQRPAHRGRFTRTKELLMTISTVTIVGAGYMAGGIAQVLAIAGFQVTGADRSVDNANASLERVQKEARDFEEQGLYAPGSADLVAENISAGKTLEEAVADVDFIEEAVFERVDVKRDVLAKISEHARPDAIIGTNTSTIPVKELESAVKHPERFLTVHFSNPAPFIPGVELVAGKDTTPETVEAVKALLEKS